MDVMEYVDKAQDSFEFVNDFGSFFKNLVHDIAQLFNLMPTYLQTLIIIVFGIMCVALILKAFATIWDAIPFI